MKKNSLTVIPNGYRVVFNVMNFCMCVSALLFLLIAASAQGQGQPGFTVQSTPEHTNLNLQLSTESGVYYTVQQSTNLTNWNYSGHYFSGGTTPLNFTNTVSTNEVGRYWRAMANQPNTAVFTNYAKWTNGGVVALNNGIVEVIIVPQANRVLQFRFLGETNGAFYEVASNSGKTNTSISTWIDYGADKAWVAPQNSWQINNRWPPTDFDRRTNAISISNGVVTMTKAADLAFGLTCTRTIELLFNQPVMRVKTTYERVQNPTNINYLNTNIAVWIDIQASVSSQSRAYIPAPTPSIFAPSNYTASGDAYFGNTLNNTNMPTSFRQQNGLMSFGTETAGHNWKYGFDSGTMVLVGTNLCLKLEAPRVAGATYTAGGSSAELWIGTLSSSPYFELEMLSPARTLATGVGDKIEYVVTYSLFHRSQGSTTDDEAQRILNWKY
jgi:hypothetical protein